MSIAPDTYRQRGTTPERSTLPRRFTSWELHSPLPQDRAAHEHVAALLDRIADFTPQIRHLAQLVYGVELDVQIRCDATEAHNAGLGVSTEQVRRLEEMGASLNVEIWFRQG